MKRYEAKYGAAANAVARLDVDQLTREKVADALAEAFDGQRDFRADLFRLTASDPLVDCAGPDPAEFAEPCPHKRVIRIGMHLRDAPDGRSAAWRMEPPTVRCVSCGSAIRGVPLS